MASDEFDIIRRFFNSGELAFPVPELILGIGDDCALLQPAPGMRIAMSMDILQEGVHFLADADPYLLGKRTLLVNLSDLAAMGARPLCFTLGVCLPDVNESWLEGFSKGLAQVAREHRCPLVGGDLSASSPDHGSITLCVQVHGELPEGTGLRRNGAKVGDLIFVTGTLGDAAAGLRVLQQTCAALLSDVDREALIQAFYLPESRVEAGQSLRNLASSCIDLSDGLAADLQHILQASGVGAQIELEAVPRSSAMRAAFSAQEQIPMAVGGGDDYELCFTVPPVNVDAMKQALAYLAVPVSEIGIITEQQGMLWCERGKPIELKVRGYQHFREEPSADAEVSPQ